MTYVAITFLVLLFLNIYCSNAIHTLFHQSKEASMTERSQRFSEEIAQLEVLNSEAIQKALSQLGSTTITRTIVTDPYGLAI